MSQKLRTLCERHPLLSLLYNLPRVFKGYQPIFLDYRVESTPRYGYGRPVHAEIARTIAENDAAYAAALSGFLAFSEQLLNIPLRQDSDSTQPCWLNKWLEGLDTIALYGFVATRRPALYLEVGSGYSTKIVRRAIRDHGLATRLVSIDPHPRAEIDALCDETIRRPLEGAELSVLDQLRAGDIFFLDGSHRSFMNSDVSVFFLEILPRLKSGVLVHIHDIHLPLDYPPERAHWYYSEQYLLAAGLLAADNGCRKYDVVLPNHYVGVTPELLRVLDPLWKSPAMAGVPRTGTSFWLQVR